MERYINTVKVADRVDVDDVISAMLNWIQRGKKNDLRTRFRPSKAEYKTEIHLKIPICQENAGKDRASWLPCWKIST